MAVAYANRRDGAGRSSKASPSAAPSSLTVHDHQQGALSDDAPLPHAHFRSDAPLRSLPRSIRNWRAQSASLSGCVRLSHSVRLRGCSPFAAQSVRYQLHQNLAVAVIHHVQSVLSKMHVAEKQLARKDFQIAGNIFQEGARQNDR